MHEDMQTRRFSFTSNASARRRLSLEPAAAAGPPGLRPLGYYEARYGANVWGQVKVNSSAAPLPLAIGMTIGQPLVLIPCEPHAAQQPAHGSMVICRSAFRLADLTDPEYLP